MERDPFVYILASGFRGTIYVGVTSDLMRRIWEHRSGVRSGFPSRYSVYRLVRYEAFGDMELAKRREKQLKNWHRQWKVNLVEELNPHWEDLAIRLGFPQLPYRPRRPRRERSGPGARGSLDPEPSSG